MSDVGGMGESGDQDLRLRVLGPPDAELWRPFVTDAVALTGLSPSAIACPPGGEEAVIACVTAETEPLLVLPGQPDVASPGRGLRVARVLVPTDRTAVERLVLRPWIERLAAAGATVEQLHVLDRRSRPVMWEGPGHHAAAWHGEIRRRHRVGTEALRICTGDPAVEIECAATAFDLILVSWGGDATADRAVVVRRLLVRRPRPTLMVRTAPAASDRKA
jgi:hypothetical protein